MFGAHWVCPAATRLEQRIDADNRTGKALPMRIGDDPGTDEVTETGMPNPRKRQALAAGAVLTAAIGAVACTPTLQIQAPDKPITINLNVKIDQEIRYKIDKDLEDAIAANPDLF